MLIHNRWSCLTWTRIDVIEASAEFRAPIYPCWWDVEVTDLYGLLEGSPYKSAGQGFSRLEKHFPPSSLRVLRDFATLNSIMSHARLQELKQDTLQHIIAVRNCIGHRLSSLPSWDDLDEEIRETMDSRAYELSRLTCVIYQNAVMFTLSPHRGWHNGLASRLRWLLALGGSRTDETDELTGLVLWSLFIGAIASLQGLNSDFFRNNLRGLLSERYAAPSEHLLTVKAALHEFVWSNEACDAGFQVIWREVVD